MRRKIFQPAKNGASAFATASAVAMTLWRPTRPISRHLGSSQIQNLRFQMPKTAYSQVFPRVPGYSRVFPPFWKRGSECQICFVENISKLAPMAFTPLTPTQWLPKPATSQFPHKSPALRASWSPLRGEGETAIVPSGAPVIIQSQDGFYKACQISRCRAGVWADLRFKI